MEFLLNLPSAISFFIVSAATTLVGLSGLYFVRKKYPTEVLRDNHEVGVAIDVTNQVRFAEPLPENERADQVCVIR